jgi:hypothetical protein
MSNSTSGRRVSGARGRWWRRAERTLFSPQAAAAAGCLTLAVMLGCGTTNHYHTTTVNEEPRAITQVSESAPADLLAQHGKITFRAGQEQVIFYPVAFAAPPNLELDDAEYYDVLEQRDTFFKVRCRTNTGYNHFVGHWHARGVRNSPPPQPAAVLAPPAPARLSVAEVPPPPMPYEGPK